ncbi:MAG: tetratricopeptide repeat protein [bacterium]|nr:tetratricopeptide repeat protein [bacterium]
MLKNRQHLLKEHLVFSFVLLLAVIVYFRLLVFGHISWDDPEMVFKNAAVQQFDLKAFFSSHYVGNYVPITMIMHALGWFLFENSDGAHHFVNIFFHLINGVLVYRLGRKLFQSEPIILLGAIVFLLHPLQMESVAWIGELKNVLSTTFYLLGLLYYVEFKSKKNISRYFLVFLFFVLGCLSKSSVVVFPLSLVCLDLLLDKKLILKQLLNKIPFFVVSVVIGFVNIQTQTADQFINHAHEFPFYQRLGFAGFALMKYLILFILPVKLSVIYPYPQLKWSVFALGFLMLIGIIFLVYYLIKKNNLAWLGVLFLILVNLVLVLQFLPFGEVLFADRYLYVPIIGLGWVLGKFVSLIKIPETVLCIILAIFFSVMGFSRAGVWKNSITLYEDILKKYPQQFVALNSAGVECMFRSEDRKALEYFNRAVDAAPNNYKGYYNRGLLLLKNRSAELAIQNFNQTIQLYNYSKAYTGRAAAYYMLNDIPKAMTDANTVLLMEPENARAHFILGNCYNDLNKLDEAMAEYNKAIRAAVDEASYYFKRAIIYGKKQDFKSSLDDLELCVSLNPEYYEAYYWKGVARVNLKQDPCSDLRIAAEHGIEPAKSALKTYCK